MKVIIFFLIIIFPFISLAQSITYSQPENQDTIFNKFEVIGKVNNNFLVHKYGNTKDVLFAYNEDMKLLIRRELDFLPSKYLADINFIPYSQFCLVIFQVLKNNKAFCKIAKIDETGKLIGEAKIIDSTNNANTFKGGEWYSVSYSENKKYILFNRSLWGLKENKLQMDQITIDEDLEIKKSDHFFIPFLFSKNFISNASIDNTGNVIFITWTKAQNKKSDLIIYKSPSDGSDLIIKSILINGYELKKPIIKINNEANIYYLASLYKDLKKANIQGLITMILQGDLSDNTKPQATIIGDSVKILADKTVPIKSSLNSYRLNDFTLKKDGGFVVTAATGTYFSNVSIDVADDSYLKYINGIMRGSRHYDYEFLSSPVQQPSLPTSNVYSLYLTQKYSVHEPSFPTSRPNVITFSFNKDNHLFTTNILNQILPTAALDFYTVMIFDKQMIFIYNSIDKKHKRWLNNFSIRTDGATMLNPVFKNYDPEYSFYPEFGKQVDSKTMIMPCTKNNQLVIAKITFDQ